MGKKSQKSTVRTTAITPANPASNLTAFSSEGTPTNEAAYYAHLHRAPDAHTLRIYDVVTGTCISRWASNSLGDEKEQLVSSLRWTTLQSSTSSSNRIDEGTAENGFPVSKRGKKRRKSDSSITNDIVVDTTSSTSIGLVIAMGLENGSILLLDPSGKPCKVLSHPSCTTTVTALSSPIGDNSESSHLWSAHSDGSVRLWDLKVGTVIGKVSGIPEGIAWDDLAVRYTSPSQEEKKPTAHLILSHLTLHIFSLPVSSPKKEKIRELKAIGIGRCTGHIEVASVRWVGPSSLPSHDSVTSSSSIANLDEPSLSLASFSKTDRFVQLWRLGGHFTDASREGELVARLALDTGVQSIAIGTSLNQDEQILAGVDNNGTVSLAILPFDIFRDAKVSASSKASKTSPAVVALSVESEISGVIGSNTGVVDATFADSKRLVACRGTVKPLFDSITFREEGGQWLPKLQLDRVANGVLNGPESASGSLASLPARYSETGQAAIRSGDTLQSAIDQDDTDLVDDVGIDEDLQEATLADRLKAMKVAKRGNNSKRVEMMLPAEDLSSDGEDESELEDGESDEEEGEGEGDDDEGMDDQTASKKTPSTTLTTTLIQALHSSDVPLLESCLSYSSPSLIRSTVMRIPSGSLVLGLLEALVERLGTGKKGADGTASVKRAKGLIEWVRQVLIIHVGFLITIPSLVNRLATLHASLTKRLSLHPTLLALNGRLDLVMSQIDLRQERAARAPVTAKRKPQFKTYVEGDSEQESDFDVGEGSSGEEVSNAIRDDSDDDHEEEGSVEDVILGSDRDVDEPEDDEDEDEEDEDNEDLKADSTDKKRASKLKLNGKPNVADMFDLEASEGEDDDDDDDDDEYDDEDEDGEDDEDEEDEEDDDEE